MGRTFGDELKAVQNLVTSREYKENGMRVATSCEQKTYQKLYLSLCGGKTLGLIKMAYIYKITNDINGKVYIGKTIHPILKRFSEHCSDSQKERCKNRPLYRAMNKYGIEHFHVELLEETNEPEIREIYWIAFYDAYHNGYNATRGGDGKPYLNYDEIVKVYQKLQNITQTAKLCRVSPEHVSQILKAQNIKIISTQTIAKEKLQKQVGMYDLQSLQLIKVFCSVRDAARFITTSKSKVSWISGHISNVCCGKSKSAYGYFWRYL